MNKITFKGDISQPIVSRVISAKMFGSLCTIMKPKDFISQILPKARNLCQDFNWEVRNIMCTNMELICQKLGSQNSSEFFFEEVKGFFKKKIGELLDDEEIEVKSSAIQLFVNTIHIFVDKNEAELECTCLGDQNIICIQCKKNKDPSTNLNKSLSIFKSLASNTNKEVEHILVRNMDKMLN